MKSGEDLDEMGSTSQGPRSISKDVLYSSRELLVNHQRVSIRMYIPVFDYGTFLGWGSGLDLADRVNLVLRFLTWHELSRSMSSPAELSCLSIFSLSLCLTSTVP